MASPRPHGIRAALGVASGLLLLVALTGCLASGDSGERPLRVASDLANPPLASRDSAGRPSGLEVELVDELSRRLERPIVWVEMPFDELLDAAAESRVDAVIASLGHTPERAERVTFTRPYFSTSIRVLVRRGPDEPRSLADLAGRVVAAAPGTTSERAVRLRLPASEIAGPALGGLDLHERLLDGDVAAAVMDGWNAEQWVRKYPLELALLEPELAAEHYCIAVRPDALELAEALDRILGDLDREGFLARLDRRYDL